MQVYAEGASQNTGSTTAKSRKSVAVEPSTVQDTFNLLRDSQNSQGIGKGTTSILASDGSGSDDEEEEEATFQLWESKKNIASYLISHVQKDADPMLLLVFTSDNESYMRSDLSRFDLLLECRKTMPESALPGGTALHLGHSRGATLQLRDLRALQDVQRPSLMVRTGAILVSIEPLKAIITRDRAFVVVPEGADDLLEPLLRHVRQNSADGLSSSAGRGGSSTSFEFVALEALLRTLVSHHTQEVQR